MFTGESINSYYHLGSNYNLPALITQVNGASIAPKTEAKSPQFVVLPIGINIGKLNVLQSASVKGYEDGEKATNNSGIFYLEQLRQETYELKVNNKSVEPNKIIINSDSPTLQELNLKLPNP